VWWSLFVAFPPIEKIERGAICLVAMDGRWSGGAHGCLLREEADGRTHSPLSLSLSLSHSPTLFELRTGFFGASGILDSFVIRMIIRMRWMMIDDSNGR
jgi:hypothetical protein